MWTLPGPLLLQFRKVVRLTFPHRRAGLPVLLEAASGRLTLTAFGPDVAVRVQVPGTHRPGRLVLDVGFMARMEGRGVRAVEIEGKAGGPAEVRWTARGVPQAAAVDLLTEDGCRPWPAPPARMKPMPAEFLEALAAAAAVAAAEDAFPRFALSGVLLRGEKGEVVGTDSRRLLRWGGFALPWKEDVVIRRLACLQDPALAVAGPVRLGRTEQAVVLTVGPWAWALTPITTPKYPPVDAIRCPELGAFTVARVPAADLAFLRRMVPRLPQGPDDHPAISLILDDRLRLCSLARNGPVVELVASGSHVDGEPVHRLVDPHYLNLPLALGLEEIRIGGGVPPVYFGAGGRSYFVMPLAETQEADRPATPETVAHSFRSDDAPEEAPRPTAAPASLASVRRLLRQAAAELRHMTRPPNRRPDRATLRAVLRRLKRLQALLGEEE